MSPLPRTQPRASLADGVAADDHLPSAELGRHDPEVRRVVVDHEHGAAGDRDRIRRRRRAPAAGASSTWIARRNVLPSPGTPLLSAVSVPSISSASRRLIARPRPVPPNRREMDTSTWLNDRNSRPIASAGIPIPVSRTVTVISQRRADRPRGASIGWPPSRSSTSPDAVNLTAFDSRLMTIWRSRPGSPTMPAGTSSSSAYSELDPLGGGLAGAAGPAPPRPCGGGRWAACRARPCRPRSWRSRGCR